MKRKNLLLIGVLIAANPLFAQQRLSLEQCRQMALESDASLQQEAIQLRMSSYDRKIARAQYYPRISAKAAYLFNDQDINLIPDDVSQILQNGGTLVQEQLSGKMTQLTQAIMSNPAAAMEYMNSPMWQTVLGALSKADVSAALNQIGQSVDQALHLDVQNMVVGAVSLVEPVYAGGKIVAANRIAVLAEELAQSRYDAQESKIIADVSQSYWQIVAIHAKKDLAENYCELLNKMVRDVETSLEAGIATESELLCVKVKANEANTSLLKATNGLKLAKMLLCKQTGLPLDSDIILEDEGCEKIASARLTPKKDMEEIYALRPEIRSLNAASKIYEQKVKVVRADMLPTLAVTANYLVTNPNLNNGFQNKFGGRFSAGVMLSVPIFHGCEANFRTQKAKAEAELYRSRLDDAKNMISLEVEKTMNQLSEANEYLIMTESNLLSAEENLRHAMIGFEEGAVDANTALGAQTAWLKAHTEYIEASIAQHMSDIELQRVQGEL